jgi:arylsulfatase
MAPWWDGAVPAAMSLHFTSNATFDIGIDLDSPVSLDYYDQAPFAFNGTIGTKISYLK